MALLSQLYKGNDSKDDTEHTLEQLQGHDPSMSTLCDMAHSEHFIAKGWITIKRCIQSSPKIELHKDVVAIHYFYIFDTTFVNR